MTLPGLIVAGASLIGAAGIGLCWRRWRHGRGGEPPAFRALLAAPRRYLGDVHDVMIRDPIAARMHVAAAGGFLATWTLAIVVHVGRVEGRLFIWALLISSGVLLAGAGLDIIRRASTARLPGGAYAALAFALVSLALFLVISTLPLSGLVEPLDWRTIGGVVVLTLGVFGAGFLIAGAPIGPMRHAFAGMLHLAYHPRGERFDGGSGAAALKALDLETAEKLGVETPADFTWRQALSFDACVQCGRCEEACPAFAAGAPLNPRRVIADLSSGLARTSTPIIASTGGIAAETLWACTTCRACVDVCPMLIEHVDAIVDMRRFETMERGATWGQGAAVLERIAETDTVSGEKPQDRLAWAHDLNLPLARERNVFDVLLWLGDGAFDARTQRTLRALISVMRKAGVDFAVLGDDELDVGDVARRLGDEATFQSLARRNIEALNRWRFKRIVTSDPHALHALRNEYPAFGGRFDVVHHTTFAAELVSDGRLVLAPKQERLTATFHDPCYLGRYNGEFEAPRELLDALGFQRVEMQRSRQQSFCCGWGGGAAFTDVPSRDRIADLRTNQARDTGASLLVTGCPNCASMFEGAADPIANVVDVIELVAEAALAGRLTERPS